MPQPFRAGLTFGDRPYGPQSPGPFLEKHFHDVAAEPQIPVRLRSGSSRLRSPGFPVEAGGFLELYAPFLTERRTRCNVRCRVAGNPARDDKGKGRCFHLDSLLEWGSAVSLHFSLVQAEEEGAIPVRRSARNSVQAIGILLVDGVLPNPG